MKEKTAPAMLETTIDKIKALVDTSTIIGEPIVSGSNTIIPVSTVTYGFASGGSDFPNKVNMELFGGGGGAGITIKPVAFLVINGDNVTVKPIVTGDSSTDKIISMIPEIMNKITDTVDKIHDRRKAEKSKSEE